MEDACNVHWGEQKRLLELKEKWYGKANVGDGADVVLAQDLDSWQKFAHDIVMDRRHTLTEPLRLMLLGTAGTGKSRTVRSFVGSRREKVRTEFEGELARAQVAEQAQHRARGGGRGRGSAAGGRNSGERSGLKKVRETMEDCVQNACLLAAPTGCASFQLKFGASTLHRVFGIPVGYCGPWKDRGNPRYLKMKTRMDQSRLFVIDEMSMVGRQMLGKIEFKVRDTLQSASKRGGVDALLGGRDTVLAGDPKQAPPIGDEPCYKEGAYTGKGQNKPKGGDRTTRGRRTSSSTWAWRCGTVSKMSCC